MDFLAGLHFFSKFSTDRKILGRIASVLHLRALHVDEFLYTPTERGFHFYIVVSGEVVAAVGNAEIDLTNRVVRQKSVENKTSHAYTKGAVFSEKIGRAATRSPGAIATKPSSVLVLDVFKVGLGAKD